MTALVFVSILTAGTVAYAGIPASDGTIHACYNPNSAKVVNGSQLNIIDSATAACSKGQQEISWNKTGPQGAQGPQGPAGPQGPTGDKGDTGAAGVTAAYINYGDGLHNLSAGTTQTVSSVTLPPGRYLLSGVIAVATAPGEDKLLVVCGFVSAGTVHGNAATATLSGPNQFRMPLNGDITATAAATPVFLRCSAQVHPAQATGEMIATQVTTITPSE
ncbi:hypothetical protein [Amycolatopsis sp. NPDC052450]|uniref:hypothetical protein n=1 Tax=Amycolatopsis sp. NPDC052450 TaxID=3363937 RepID=UPI0037C7F51A